MRKTTTLAALLFALTSAGCATQTPPPATMPDVNAAKTPARPSLDWSMTTALAPPAALQRIEELFTSAGFQIVIPGPQQDYFSAHLDARTADDHEIHINCEWLADGKTLITMRSNLNDNEHTYLAKKIRETIEAPPATQE